MDSFFEKCQSGESLLPELEDYLEFLDEGFIVLRHPLVFAVPYIKELNFLYNQQFKAKTEMQNKALEKNNWNHYIWMTERPYRLNGFLEIEGQIKNDKLWWEILGEIWTDSENIWQSFGTWLELLHSDRKNKNFFMNKEERGKFKQLPEELVVYRGCEPRNKLGLSWTLDKDKAEWFSKRFNNNGCVIEKTISKSQIFAYLSRRGEEEIILLPNNLFV